jgi:hypothetical protein
MNLSFHSLTENQSKLLDKGLNFIPNLKLLPVSTILEDKMRLIRSIRLHCAYSDNKLTLDNKLKRFVEKSNFIPSDTHLRKSGTLHLANNLIDKIEFKTNQILSNLKYCEKNGNRYMVLDEKNNLTKEETIGLNELKSNDKIVIKPADKGGKTVIMNKEDYLTEAYRQLNDANYYKKIKDSLIPQNINKLTLLLKSMFNDGFITKKQFDFLSGPTNPRPRQFYMLPKIHKNPDSWTIPNRMPQARPIVSDVESESYRISQLIESYLTPLSNKHPSYIKNTYDFVEKIRNKIVNKDVFIVTADINSLYTVMSHDLTISSVKSILQKYPDQNRPDEYIVELLDIMLKNNDFNFNDETFLQTCGCPMGKVIGPAAANIYLLEFDRQAMEDFPKKPLLFLRYLDDIFILWEHNLDELKEYEKFLNNLIPGITLNFECSKISGNFLDVTIYKHENNDITTLKTKVYFKPTDAHSLLHSNSFHPPHTVKGILKSQLIRFQRISSSWSDYLTSAKILFHSLKDRGYSWSSMWRTMKDVWFYERNENITANTSKNEDNTTKLFPIIVQYNSIGKRMASAYKSIINSSPISHNYRTITAFRNSQNLTKKLIRNKTTSTPKAHPAFHFVKCPHGKCKACPYISTNADFSSSVTNTKFKVQHNFNCGGSNLVYLITCNKCSKQYVGQTGRSLRRRISDHLSCIRTKRSTPIGTHFNLIDHNITDFKIQPIESISQLSINDLNVRLKRESFWQFTLHTNYPYGLNNQKILTV